MQPWACFHKKDSRPHKPLLLHFADHMKSMLTESALKDLSAEQLGGNESRASMDHRSTGLSGRSKGCGPQQIFCFELVEVSPDSVSADSAGISKDHVVPWKIGLPEHHPKGTF